MSSLTALNNVQTALSKLGEGAIIWSFIISHRNLLCITLTCVRKKIRKQVECSKSRTFTRNKIAESPRILEYQHLLEVRWCIIKRRLIWFFSMGPHVYQLVILEATRISNIEISKLGLKIELIFSLVLLTMVPLFRILDQSTWATACLISSFWVPFQTLPNHSTPIATISWARASTKLPTWERSLLISLLWAQDAKILHIELILVQE